MYMCIHIYIYKHIYTLSARSGRRAAARGEAPPQTGPGTIRARRGRPPAMMMMMMMLVIMIIISSFIIIICVTSSSSSSSY